MSSRPTFKRQESDAANEVASAPVLDSKESPDLYADDSKNGFPGDVKGVRTHLNPADEAVEDLAAENLLANGKERPIETAEDIATRCISLDDDPTLPVHTIRMWFLGLGLSCFGAVLGQIFYFRPQTVFVSQLFLQVIAYFLGIFWAKILPKAKHGKFWAILNPGEFNIKEHVAILIMASTASDSALAISVFAANELYYGLNPNYGVAIFTLLGSQMFGYGLAGLLRSFTVYPTLIVFPNLVPVVNLFDVLHRDMDASAQKKRFRFFWIVFAAIFVWEWIPEYMAPTLTGISIFCLANQDSAWFTRIFGGSNGNEGLGMFSLCLDWNYVGSGGGSLGALFTPFSTQISQYCGVALCIILFCSCYVTNVWNAQNFPFLSQDMFYENGTQYDQMTILNADFSLNQTALEEQGLPWYATSNAIYYVGSNLAIGATFTHVICWYMPSIIAAVKQWRQGTQPDPHWQKMQVYKEVPMWWYGVIMAASFAMAMATCYTGKSQLPWWALIVALLLAAFTFPFAIVVYAITGFNTDVQQLSQMLGAALVPGNSQANMYFTLYGSNTVSQARGLTRDLKMGQYTKLPPRATFAVQLAGTVVGAILQLILMKTIISAQREILLDVQGSNIWSGQQVQSFNSQAVTWGALAQSMYAPGSRYFIVPMSIIIGLFVPIPFWILHKFFPKMKFDRVVTPIMCWCLGYLSVGINSSVFTTFLLCIFSQFYLRKYRATWFRKYNYLLSAGLDGGTQFMTFIATFAVFGASGAPVDFPNWALNPAGRVNYDYCKRLT
ncbi:hypothetical protein OIV83_002102 [Microbotryomycetes sp. JL201]|nr:hypothetical protein OIV83_002102 [Microbotryomycetes sp. JL201]